VNAWAPGDAHAIGRLFFNDRAAKIVASLSEMEASPRRVDSLGLVLARRGIFPLHERPPGVGPGPEVGERSREAVGRQPKNPLIWIMAGRARSRMPRAAVDAAAAGGTT
jgi:hypothetical protein